MSELSTTRIFPVAGLLLTHLTSSTWVSVITALSATASTSIVLVYTHTFSWNSVTLARKEIL